MSEDFIDKPKVNFEILRYLQDTVDHLSQVCLKKANQLFGLSDPHSPCKYFSVSWKDLLNGGRRDLIRLTGEGRQALIPPPLFLELFPDLFLNDLLLFLGQNSIGVNDI